MMSLARKFSRFTWYIDLAAIVALVGLGATTLVDCATAPPVVVAMQVPTLHVHDQAEVTRDGLTVGISPITADNIRRMPQAHHLVSWNIQVQRGAQSIPVQGEADLEILPMPTFQVRLANHTGHVLRFTQTVFRLQDNLGRTYPLFAGTSDLVAWNEGKLSGTVPEVQAVVLPQVRAAVGQIQLLNRNVEILNGDEWTGYLVFNVNVASHPEYLALMNSVNRLTVRMAEIPVEVNDAGAPTRTTEFAFNFDLAQATMDATCPADAATPSLSVCTW